LGKARKSQKERGDTVRKKSVNQSERKGGSSQKEKPKTVRQKKEKQ
jgi:hypothetical protein